VKPITAISFQIRAIYSASYFATTYLKVEPTQLKVGPTHQFRSRTLNFNTERKLLVSENPGDKQILVGVGGEYSL
jgi:hypothetical protein